MSLLPWQEPVWQELLQRQRGNGLPHAMLLTGNKGIGKHGLALHTAQWLLCQNRSGQACGECHSCKLWAAGSHPDFLLCVPEEGSRQIRIDAIRKVNEFLAQTPQISQSQVVILSPVEVMNSNAANALLKTLEEPAGESYLLLETERFGSVLPTIRSRCQRLTLATPSAAQALSWLQQQGIDSEQASLALRLNMGAPLAALAWLQQERGRQQQQWQQQLGQWSRGELALQPLAESWSKIEMSDVTSWFYLVLSDCLKARMGVPAAQQTLAGDVQALCDCATLDPAKLLTLQAKVQAVLGQLLSGLGNYNKQLLCESLLLHWQALIQNGQSPSGTI
ncbi:DNA polymerase III subunit delta' [Oceanospirillaceae bacterium ASx5O]|nr:DNA polymerase III subunit delta' [Oceanospirillaceae bacterium ASx5O]